MCDFGCLSHTKNALTFDLEEVFREKFFNIRPMIMVTSFNVIKIKIDKLQPTKKKQVKKNTTTSISRRNS